jgi:hypothetical protein
LAERCASVVRPLHGSNVDTKLNRISYVQNLINPILVTSRSSLVFTKGKPRKSIGETLYLPNNIVDFVCAFADFAVNCC